MRKKHDKVDAEVLIADLLEIQDEHPERNITRDFYRAASVYGEDWSRHFGTFQEFRRQAGLMATRAQQKFERQISKHVDADVYRKYYKEQVLPWHRKYEWTGSQKGRFRQVVFGSDFHDKEVDRFCLDVFIDTCARLQPAVICLGGDIWDLYEFSRFTVDPRKVDIKGRFDFVRKMILARLRLVCPTAQIDILAGNHEFRLMKLLADGQNQMVRILLADVLGLGLKDIFGLDEFKINLVAKLDLAAFNPGDMNEEINQNYTVYYDTLVAAHQKNMGLGLSGFSGHTHRPDQTFFDTIPSGRLCWTVTGGMCRYDAEYVEGHCSWHNGFGIATIDTQKRKAAIQHVTCPGDYVVVEGKLYERAGS